MYQPRRTKRMRAATIERRDVNKGLEDEEQKEGGSQRQDSATPRNRKHLLLPKMEWWWDLRQEARWKAESPRPLHHHHPEPGGCPSPTPGTCTFILRLNQGNRQVEGKRHRIFIYFFCIYSMQNLLPGHKFLFLQFLLGYLFLLRNLYLFRNNLVFLSKDCSMWQGELTCGLIGP